MEIVNVVVVANNVIETITSFVGENAGTKAEAFFIDTLKNRLSNFDEYTIKDIENILEDGYESFGNGSVCLAHSVTEEG